MDGGSYRNLWSFNFGHIFISIVLPLSAWQNQTLFGGKWVISFCLEVGNKNQRLSFAWGHEEKRTDSIFSVKNVFFRNINTITFQILYNQVGIYSFEKKFKKYTGDANPVGVQRNVRGCILEVDSVELGC